MIQKPRGTEDIILNNAKETFALKMIIRNVMDLYNFDEIETPIFESLELFKRGVGEDTDVVSKEMFTFNDKKNREFALRPEGTAATVRAVIENKMYIPENLPLKLFYIGQMFRYERPQAGRQRQFNQLGIEVFGSKTPEIDAEVITVGYNLLSNIGLENTVCHINYLVSNNERVKYIADLKSYLSKKTLCDDCVKRVQNNPLRVLDCKIDSSKFDDVIDMKDYLSKDDLKHFEDIIKILEQVNIKVVVDKMLVRGLDYYTGFVFEIKSTDERQGSQSTLLGGGRYDELVKQLGGPDLPAAGFGLGIERIMIALQNAELTLANEKKLDVYIVALSEKAKKLSSLLLMMIRNSGMVADTDYMNRSFKSVFKQVEKFNTKNVIIIGDNELKENVVVIKNQQTKSEEKVSLDKIIEHLQK